MPARGLSRPFHTPEHAQRRDNLRPVTNRDGASCALGKSIQKPAGF
jgi:hypothetical protein